MKNLFKYEFRKTLPTKLILLGITAAAQAVYLIGLWRDKDQTVVWGMALLFFTAVFGILFIGLQSVLTLHRDMNTKQSYMLFMTPNSCYAILGAKMLENLLSMAISGAFFFGLGMLDIELLSKHYQEIGSFMNAFKEMLRMFRLDLDPDAGYLASAVFGVLSSWFATITAAFLADVVSSALLNGKKFNLLISFALFLVLSYLMSKVSGLAGGEVMTVRREAVRVLSDGTEIYTDTMTITEGYFLREGLVSLGFSVLFYVAAAELMQRKLSV